MGGPVSESLEGTAAVGDGGGGGDKDEGKNAGAGYAIQGSRAVSGVICSDSGVVTGAKVIEVLNHQLLRRITGMTGGHMTSEEWEWPLVDEALDISRLCTIKGYIQRRKATIPSHVICQLIYEIYTGEERIPVTKRFIQWRDQDVGQEVE